MAKQILVHSYNGVLLSNKKEQIIDTCNSLEDLKSIILVMKGNLQSLHTV